MIKVTRLDGREMVVHADHILYLEERPDTLITLDNEKTVLVREKADELVSRIIAYYRSLRPLPAAVP